MVIKKGVYGIIILMIFLIMLTSSLVSADFADWFKKTITGRASSAGTNISISVTGTNAITIDRVWNDSLAGTSMDPTARGTTTIEFNVTITDIDGVNDINDSSVRAELINGTVTRVNSTCADLAEETTNSANFSCSIDLYYFDATGPWIINITANDLGATTYVSNYSETFYYPVLQSIEVSQTALTWPSVSPGATNQTSDNDPTYINNTGNYNATGNIAVTAYDLYGATGASINASNFTVDIDTGNSCSGGACTECDGAVLANGTDTQLDGSGAPLIVLEAGNVTDDAQNNVIANATLWYCLFEVPGTLPSQTYSTSEAGSSDWIIKLV